jgi:tyrosyl-tRNA synthetase
MSTRLGASHDALMSLLRHDPDLRDPVAVLDVLARRRGMDFSDLSPTDQAALLAGRAHTLLPGQDALAGLLSAERPLTVKFGIDPTAADVHIGHAVPMIVASRFQRMGHRVVFIVGDVTGKIGDPSGRSADRPALTDDDIRANMATYRRQVSPFFDFDRAEFRYNSEWLGPLTLPRFLDVLARIPLSMSLQRDDFRERLAAGAGLSTAELVYSVVMALDSVEVNADVEIGGLDQLLNMQMCRRVMENAGQRAEHVVATVLIEGTDGTGEKMSKSRGNYVGLAFPPADVYGRLMSAPDRLLPAYLRALTELLDPEIDVLSRAHPMAVKALLASDLTATIHGAAAAEEARTAFTARFSRRRFSEVTDLPTVDRAGNADLTVADVLVRLAGAVPSRNRVRAVAADGGLRLVTEHGTGEPETARLTAEDADRPLADLPAAPPDARTFLRCGRAVVELR